MIVMVNSSIVLVLYHIISCDVMFICYNIFIIKWDVTKIIQLLN